MGNRLGPGRTTSMQQWLAGMVPYTIKRFIRGASWWTPVASLMQLCTGGEQGAGNSGQTAAVAYVRLRYKTR